MFVGKVKKLLLLTTVLISGFACVGLQPAFAGNSAAGDKKVYHVQVTGQFLRKEALELLDLINEKRQSVNQESLVMDGAAVGVSDLRAVQISFVNYHLVPTEHGTDYLSGKVLSQINTENGPSGEEEYGIENIVTASGYKTENIAEKFFESWMNSSGHREAMLYKMKDRVGISIFTQGNIDGTYSYYGVLNSLILDDPSEPALIPELCKNYVRIPYRQGEKTVTKTFNLSLRGDCIAMDTKRYQGEFSVRFSPGQSKKLHAIYNALPGLHAIPKGHCLNKLDDSCGTWTTTNPDVVSVSSDGVVTGRKPGTAKVYFNLNGDPDKSSEYTVHVSPIKLGTPGKVSVKKYKNDKIRVSWARVKKAEGYRICYYQKKGSRKVNIRYKNISSASVTKHVLKNIKKGTYYVQIRACSSVKEKKIYGKYSSPKRINIK